MQTQLQSTHRLLMEATLRPVQGDRFQPTGFPDLGAAIYERPDGRRMLLVESAQSVANRLEHGLLDGATPRLRAEFDGLPYILVTLKGKASKAKDVPSAPAESLTSSLFEAHRVNSPFIIQNKSFGETFRRSTGYEKGKALDWPAIARALFRLDPNSLLHGVFMANFEDGRIKMPRALSGFIEAAGVTEVHSGGVKNNPLDPSGRIRASDYDKDVYGNVPYHRVEYAAEEIRAYFNLDLALLRGYGLPEAALDLLVALALHKIRFFLDGGLRLRSACDLRLDGEPKVTQPDGISLPSLPDTQHDVRAAIVRCRDEGLFADPPVTELTTEVERKAKKEGNKEAEVEDDSQEGGGGADE